MEVRTLLPFALWDFHNMKEKKYQSRRATPWDDKKDRTPIEEFIVGCTRDNYDKNHIAPGDEREISLLN